MSERIAYACARSARAPLTAALLACGVGLLGSAGVAGVTSSALAADAPAQGAPVQIRQAWIRWLPANLPAGGYLTLSNPSARTVSLVGASSPDYGSVMLHRSLEHNGTSRMVPVAHIDVAPHSTLSFASLGYHLMLMRPRTSITPGDHVPVTLRFADGRSMTVSFQVVKPSAGAPADTSMANMPGMKGTSH
ncbi:MAG TPA: copper chaperone PCu(A)C [Steroidobacteraceae bacterium]|nr:copper chaperone PCu(A)C [Steroidobacteraceae bacterium]